MSLTPPCAVLCGGVGEPAEDLQVGDQRVHLGQPPGTPSKARTVVASP